MVARILPTVVFPPSAPGAPVADVRLVDLEVLKRFSLVLRREFADAEDVLAALDTSRSLVLAALGRPAATEARAKPAAKPAAKAARPKAPAKSASGRAAPVKPGLTRETPAKGSAAKPAKGLSLIHI